jgi:hypothetical protein
MKLNTKQKIELATWDWPDWGRGELGCPHGVGHGGIHGCDGCCSHPSYEVWLNKRVKKGFKTKK